MRLKLFIVLSSMLFCFSLSGQGCLVSNYPFSGNLNDVAGSNNASSNAVALTTDRFNNANSAYQFNGTSSWIDLKSSYDYAKKSINVWFYLDTIAKNNEMIYLSDNPNLNYGLTAFSSEYTNGKLYLRSFGGNVNDIGKKEIKTKTWYMATITVDNAKNEAKHYLNGKLYATTTSGTVTSVDGLNTSVLGTTRHKTSPFFKGKIDDVSIYNCIIDSNAVWKLYSESPCLVACYTFSGNMNDLSPNANHASGNAVILTTDRFNKSNSAYQFNGTTSWIDLKSNHDYAKKSINVWFYFDTIATKN